MLQAISYMNRIVCFCRISVLLTFFYILCGLDNPVKNLTTHLLPSISHFSYLVPYIDLINVVIVQRINVNIKSLESPFTSLLSLLSHLVLYKRRFLLACQS